MAIDSNKIRETKQALKDIRDKEELQKYLNAEQAKRDESRKTQDTQDEDSMTQMATTKDERGQEVSLKSYVIDKADRSIKEPPTAFNDFRHAMMSLIYDLSLVSDLVHLSAKKSFGPIAQAIVEKGRELVDDCFHKTWDTRNWNNNHPEVDLPKLEYQAQFDDHNHFTGFKITTEFKVEGEDADALTSALDKEFNGAVDTWFLAKHIDKTTWTADNYESLNELRLELTRDLNAFHPFEELEPEANRLQNVI